MNLFEIVTRLGDFLVGSIGARRVDRIAAQDKFGYEIESILRYYVEPDCQNLNPADDKPEGIVLRTPLLAHLWKFLNQELVVRDGYSVLFVLADAGMGKTTLLQLLHYRLAHRLVPQKCILLKLEESTLTDISKIPGKSETILLLDALDEDPLAYGNTMQRLQAILDESRSFRRTIISCRTQYFPEGSKGPFSHIGFVSVAGYTCPSLFLSAFNKAQVNSYLNKRFRRWTRDRREAGLIVENMGELSSRPLLLAHIDMLRNSALTHWSSYTIYSSMVETWLLREIPKFRLMGMRHVTPALLQNACRLIACWMQSSGTTRISMVEIDLLKEHQPDLDHISSLDLGGRSLLNRDSDGSYRFAHYSVQEYLVASTIIATGLSKLDPISYTSGILQFLRDSKISFGRLPPPRLNAEIAVMDLRGATMTATIVSDLTIGAARLCDISAHQSRWSNLSIKTTDLSRAQLYGATLSQVTLGICVVQNAKMENVTLRNVSASESDFRGLVASGCNMIDCSFPKALLAGASLDRATITQTVLREISFVGRVVTGLRIVDSDLSFSDLQRCEFHNCSFVNCSFAEAVLEACHFVDCSFEGTVWNNAFVHGINFVQCTIKATSLIDAFVGPRIEYNQIPSRMAQFGSTRNYELNALDSKYSKERGRILTQLTGAEPKTPRS